MLFLPKAYWKQQPVGGRWGKRGLSGFLCGFQTFFEPILTATKRCSAVTKMYVHPEIAEAKGSVPHTTGLTSDTSYKLGPPSLLTSWLQVQGFPWLLLDLIVHQDDLRNSGKCYTYNSGFIIAKGTNQNQQKEEMHTARSGKFQVGSFCRPQGASAFLAHWCGTVCRVLLTREFTQVLMPSFHGTLLRRCHWLHHCPHGWTPERVA